MSSPSDSPARRRLDPDINMDLLIAEVKKRPALWNKSLLEYSDRLYKLKLWDEASEHVIENWNELSDRDRRIIGTEIRKKWRNVKDTFIKEVAALKNRGDGPSSKRKRRYVHFEALSFLTPQITERKPIYDSDQDEKLETKRARLKCKFKRTSNDDGREIIDGKIYDEDISFSEMIVPMLKKLNDDQKHYAKIEILNILNSARHTEYALD